jgi:predicted ArsR family transcriptional regulator
MTTLILFTTLYSVENNQVSKVTLGPRSAAGQRPLSRSRAAILDVLRSQSEPLTQAALVTSTGLHENTIREHLDGLLRRRLVRRFRAEPSGRGRPAWLYEATAAGADSEYAGLASALAASIARTSRSPRDDAIAAGEEWGRDLARNRAGSADSPQAARDLTVELLDDLGFEPRRQPDDPSELRLTRCPLLQAAHRHQEVVCGVHLGIVRGALQEYGADPTGSRLLPFAEPGACLLVVPPVPPVPRSG